MPFYHAEDSLDRSHSIPFAIESVLTEEGLPALEADWNRLSGNAISPNVFSTFDWFRSWMKSLRQEGQGSHVRPNVLLLKQDRAVAGIAPLVLRQPSRFGFSLRKLEFVTIHADYNDLVLGRNSEFETEAVIEHLARTAGQWEIADLRDLRDTGNTIARLERALVRARLHYRLLPENDRCPYLPIRGPWSETMPQKHLLDTRRAFRRFQEMAKEGFRVRFVEKPQLEPGLLERMIVVEAQKHVDGKLSIPVLGKYFEVFQTLFNTLGPSGWITVGLVEQEDRLVAWRLFYRCGDKLWDYLTAYDHTYANLSPGKVLIGSAIDHGFAKGLRELDFLRGEEAYKLRWTSGFKQNHRLLIWNRRLKSRFSASAYLKLRA